MNFVFLGWVWPPSARGFVPLKQMEGFCARAIPCVWHCTLISTSCLKTGSLSKHVATISCQLYRAAYFDMSSALYETSTCGIHFRASLNPLDPTHWILTPWMSSNIHKFHSHSSLLSKRLSSHQWPSFILFPNRKNSFVPFLVTSYSTFRVLQISTYIFF